MDYDKFLDKAEHKAKQARKKKRTLKPARKTEIAEQVKAAYDKAFKNLINGPV